MDTIQERMKKNYEERCKLYLTRRIPVIIRVDGRAFHTLTKKFQKPFDMSLVVAMKQTAMGLVRESQGAKIAYIQSDEISILLTDFDRLTTEAWFDYNLQKITSVSASIATLTFNKVWTELLSHDIDFHDVVNATFDARAFNVPREEVCNYFISRQRDWIRNSVSMLARSKFSHSKLVGKKRDEMKAMLIDAKSSWESLRPVLKNGTTIIVDGTINVFEDYDFSRKHDEIEELIKERD